MSNPKVSIIVPVFNVKTYLRECLDSILAQTLPEIEIICGDGGSNDGSLEIIQEYAQKDSRVHYITKEKSGYGQSVNECMAMAKGEYIGIVESDDAVEPNTYETLYGLAHQNDLDWIRGDIYYYYSGLPKEQQLQRESIIYGGDFYNIVLNPQTDYRPYKSGLRTWSGIYKTAFLRENGIEHNETPGGSYQDVGFYLKTLYYAKRVYFVDKAFYKWRQDNPGSSVHYNSGKLVEKSLNEWHLNQQYLDEHPNIGNRAKASYNYRKFFSYLWTIDMAVGDDKLKVQKLAAEEFTKALNNGEIDKGFFEVWEWERFNNELNVWKTLSNEKELKEDDQEKHQMQTISQGSQGDSFKVVLKKALRPVAHLAKKIIYKLMGDVIFKLENELSSLRLRVNETAEDTQWQVRECTAELHQLLQEVKKENAELRADMAKGQDFNQQLTQQLEKNWQALSDLNATLEHTKKDLQIQMSESARMNAEFKAALNGVMQMSVTQNSALQDVKVREENIHDMVALTKQKVLDQGEILWGIKTRDEDVYDALVITKQKVLDQGDVLWNTRDKIKDVEALVRHNADAMAWNMLFESNRGQMEKLVGTSPLYDSAFYWNNRYGSIISAQHILSVLFKMLPHKSVIDFGCGTGTWLWVAKALGTEEIFGIDGDYVPQALLIIPIQSFMAANLEKPVAFERKYDLAISMEVAEHLPESAADTYMDSLCAGADTIVFSAAHPGQGGDGHVNEQPREYWIEKFAIRGFELREIKQYFIDDTKIEPWYRENIMLFVKE